MNLHFSSNNASLEEKSYKFEKEKKRTWAQNQKRKKVYQATPSWHLAIFIYQDSILTFTSQPMYYLTSIRQGLNKSFKANEWYVIILTEVPSDWGREAVPLQSSSTNETFCCCQRRHQCSVSVTRAVSWYKPTKKDMLQVSKKLFL